MKNRYIQMFSFLVVLLLFATFSACEVDGELDSVADGVPEVITLTPFQKEGNYFVVGGNVISSVGKVKSRGVVYSTQQNPTISNLNNTIRPWGSGAGEFILTLTDLQINTTYYIRAYATNDVGTAYGEQKSFTTNEQQSAPNDGTENGYAYVDLGLSVKWATMNVGANKPEDYGDYFAWGETTTKDNYNWGTYKHCSGLGDVYILKYNTSSSEGTVDNKTQLELTDDAAHVNWGGSWRMPTYAEWTELIEQCTWTWMYLNGAYGKKVTSKTNGNSIFLPAAGCREEKTLYIVNSYGSYWSSSLLTKYSAHARSVYFVSSNMDWRDYLRHYGNSVRPVCP